MNITIMGIRGIPANYGGFETFIEEIAPRLVERGHNVTVYGRSNCIDYKEPFYKGVRIRILPTISHKYLDTVVHTFLCAVANLFHKSDIVFICNSANAAFSFIPRFKGTPVVLNVDGLEWKRKKWNALGKAFYKISEFLATFLPNTIVSDAKVVQNYYADKFGKSSVYIPYGAPDRKVTTTEVLEKFNVGPGEYILYVSRMEPENNAHRVVKAFEQVKTDKKLVMVGDAPYNSEYIQNLKATKDKRIIFTGYVFGQGYKEFQSHAYFYVQGTEVGGTHPALLEGMGYGNCILANDVPEHHEVIEDAGLIFSKTDDNDLVEKMQYLCEHPDVVKDYENKIIQKVHDRFCWEKVTKDYEDLFYKVTRIKKQSI